MTEKRMCAAEIVEMFGGTRIDPVDLTRYERWALELFHDKRYLSNPNLKITLQLDITAAEKAYNAQYAAAAGASLTAYLKWTLLAAIARHPCFSYRDLGGEWYRFERLPLFFPVATGTKERFQEVLIEDAGSLGWPAFSAAYREAIERIRREDVPYEPIPDDVWSVAHFIGNLPELQFTSLHLHEPSDHVGRPVFYFGKRYRDCARLFIPFYVLFDHSNLDPVVVNLLLKDYERIFSGEEDGASHR